MTPNTLFSNYRNIDFKIGILQFQTIIDNDHHCTIQKLYNGSWLRIVVRRGGGLGSDNCSLRRGDGEAEGINV